MAGLPFCNPALQVEAVGFAIHDDQWLGVLVTPWAMNLLLIPARAETWISAPEGRRLMIRYPAGEFAFLGGEEAELGEYLACPLFASMAEFADQETARLAARAALIALGHDQAAASQKSAVTVRHDAAEPPASPSRRRLFSRGS